MTAKSHQTKDVVIHKKHYKTFDDLFCQGHDGPAPR